MAAPGVDASLLMPGEPPAALVANATGGSPFVLVCDHASNRVPARLGTLGLDPARLAEHIGWDPGALAVARGLAAELDAPLVASGYSRLVIDCNRPLESPESIPEQSDGVPVPGNRGLSPQQRALRVDTLFRPYHDAIARLLDDRLQRPTLLLSVHSFTPILAGKERPWHVGISARGDRRLARPLIRALAARQDVTVGDDEPYPIDDEHDFTLPASGEARSIPCAMIEIRQDGIAAAGGAAAWASRLAAACRTVALVAADEPAESAP